MLIFWIICGLLVLLALWFVLPAFLQQGEETRTDDRRAANLLVYQDQYQELEADLKNGLIAQEQFQQEKDELERRVLDDVKAKSTDSPAPSRLGEKVGYGIAAAIPMSRSRCTLSWALQKRSLRRQSPAKCPGPEPIRRRTFTAADGSQRCQAG